MDGVEESVGEDEGGMVTGRVEVAGRSGGKEEGVEW